jgi:hypothetical protein
MRAVLCCLAVLLGTPAFGDDLPSCLPSGSVQLNPESPSDGWLSKASADEVRRYIGKVAGAGQWDGTTLYLMCAIQGPAIRMKVADVRSAGRGVPAAGNRRTLSNLARRTGHTQQEADVLSGKYERLAGALFRLVQDEDGSLVGEDEVILRKHKERAGVGEPAEAREGEGELSEEQASALEEQIDAAQQRGDLKEVTRLAMQARAAAAPATARANQAGARVEKGTWQALEGAFPELAQAAYRSAISLGACPCARCALPVAQGP